MSYQMGWSASRWDGEDWVETKWFRSERGAWGHVRKLIGTVYGGIANDGETHITNERGRALIVREMHVFK